MSRWIYTLCNAVWSKSTHDHDDAAMCLPWTTVLCWPLARSFVNKELKTVHYMIHGETTLFLKREWASEQANERKNEWTRLMGTESCHRPWNPPLLFTAQTARMHTLMNHISKRCTVSIVNKALFLPPLYSLMASDKASIDSMSKLLVGSSYERKEVS